LGNEPAVKLLYIFPEEFTGRFAREYHVYRLAESLAAAGCDVTLVAAPSERLGTAGQLRDLFGGSGSERLSILWLKREMTLGPWKIRSSAWFFHQLDRIVHSLQPDGVYTMHLKAADHMAKKYPALPLVFEAHEIFADTYEQDSPKHERLAQVEDRIYRQVRGVVAISNYLAECLLSQFPLQVPIRVQHDGIDEAMLLETSAQTDPRELIYVGSLQPWKGVPVAIEAMRLLPEFHLTVIGGEGKSLDQLRQNTHANVTFLGHLSREALRPHLQKAAIGIMPNLLKPRSALYTFPLKLLEYSAAGKGIIASEIPVFQKLNLSPWVSLVPSGSAEAIAEAVRKRGELGIDSKAARNWASQFIWARQGEVMKPFLDSLFPTRAP
jgi:glycosyltransferase involved in cell wall biosynthesis